MSPMQAIKSATSLAAHYMGSDADVGSVEAGKYGDLIAVRGDPLKNITVLQNVDAVVKGGLLFKR
jgi:imidazolonepropionase-like amidohydrolase